jgi:membrane protein required for colicin V production
MENLPLTILDIVLIIIILVSAGFAFFRGFISEVLGMVAWGGAIFATLYGLPLFRPYVRAHIRPDALADTVLVLTLAIVSLVVFKLAAGYIGDRARQSRLGALDRSLGILFGLFRGLLVVCIAYMMISWIIPRDKQPDWIKTARMRPLIERGSNFVRSLLPAEFAQHIGPFGNDEDVKDILKEMKPKKPEPASDKKSVGDKKSRKGKGNEQKP